MSIIDRSMSETNTSLVNITVIEPIRALLSDNGSLILCLYYVDLLHVNWIFRLGLLLNFCQRDHYLFLDSWLSNNHCLCRRSSFNTLGLNLVILEHHWGRHILRTWHLFRLFIVRNRCLIFTALLQIIAQAILLISTLIRIQSLVIRLLAIVRLVWVRDLFFHFLFEQRAVRSSHQVRIIYFFKVERTWHPLVGESRRWGASAETPQVLLACRYAVKVAWHNITAQHTFPAPATPRCDLNQPDLLTLEIIAPKTHLPLLVLSHICRELRNISKPDNVASLIFIRPQHIVLTAQESGLLRGPVLSYCLYLQYLMMSLCKVIINDLYTKYVNFDVYTLYRLLQLVL